MAATVGDLLHRLKLKPVIAGLRDLSEIDDALEAGCSDLRPWRRRFQLQTVSEKCARASALLFIHADLMKGIAVDEAGTEVYQRVNVHFRILTTRSYLVRAAKEAGLLTIMRLFCLDTEALQTGIQACGKCQPHAVEVLPGLVAPKILPRLPQGGFPPLIAGGLISTIDEARATLVPGIAGLSSSNRELWYSNVQVFRG